MAIRNLDALWDSGSFVDVSWEKFTLSISPEGRRLGLMIDAPGRQPILVAFPASEGGFLAAEAMTLVHEGMRKVIEYAPAGSVLGRKYKKIRRRWRKEKAGG